MAVLVAGVARNCAEQIESDIAQLRAALVEFGTLHWLVIESDSDDDTVATLEAISANERNFRFQTMGRLADKYPQRTDRIAVCRNAYLEELNSNPVYAAVDLVIMADLDGMNNMLTARGVASCFSRTDWDICTANQAGRYYDVWALRHPIWCPNDCWKQAVFLKKYGLETRKARFTGVYSKQVTIPPDSEWLEVESAFGGLAIYRREVLRDAQYSGIGPHGEKICEHVPMHAGLREKGCVIMLNPALINTGELNGGDPSPFSIRGIRAMLRQVRDGKS